MGNIQVGPAASAGHVETIVAYVGSAELVDDDDEARSRRHREGIIGAAAGGISPGVRQVVLAKVTRIVTVEVSGAEKAAFGLESNSDAGVGFAVDERECIVETRPADTHSRTHLIWPARAGHAVENKPAILNS